ncbi:thiol:disulfide interchange protein [Legionella quinlivanii]|uniref:Thiol:disulfide interchange protein n=1 Tax=Legionella quinlivanii TaxID=45073 RepID=A0A364LHS2_9GAMM|nr:protein-disulfide reductase DsbD [Legionella quinlivanii]RAP35874.1 thiol:disulfide interchange protein [Legionella quinlivanii]
MYKWLFLLSLAIFNGFGYAAPLSAEEVFTVKVKPVDPNTFSIDWQIKPGYFLYRDRISLSAPADPVLQFGSIIFPQASEKKDRQGHSYLVYRDALSLLIPVLGEQSGETSVSLHYQGCSDDGFCYPPETKQIKLAINEQLALVSASTGTAVKAPPVVQTSDQESDAIADIYENSHWFMVILSFFGFGLLLAFTPCVLPMVPVLSGIIVGHGHDISTRKAFLLSFSYVLSMSLTYAIAGAIVATLGSNLQIIMQAPWAIGLFSLIFILLALSMFGFFELKLPVSWQAKLAKASRSQHGGHYLGAAIMGCLSTLILSPCVTAPLIGALGYIAHSGNVLFGSLTLFFLGLGMGTPLLLIGTSAGKWLPRAGTWMNSVKNFFGFLLLAVAIYLMGRLLPPPVTMILWAALLVFSGIFAGALNPAQNNSEKMHQSTGILLLVYGLLILAGASMGSKDPLLPLAGIFSKATAASMEREELIIKTPAELKEALQTAEGRPVMLDFYADWCASCKVIASSTLNNTEIKRTLGNFLVLKIDVTANDAAAQALMKQYQVVAPPTFLFFNSAGKELSGLRLVGDVSTREFLDRLQKVETLARN